MSEEKKNNETIDVDLKQVSGGKGKPLFKKEEPLCKFRSICSNRKKPNCTEADFNSSCNLGW